jgi:hypothetical protein
VLRAYGFRSAATASAAAYVHRYNTHTDRHRKTMT